MEFEQLLKLIEKVSEAKLDRFSLSGGRSGTEDGDECTEGL